jgi:hypothetical protein
VKADADPATACRPRVKTGVQTVIPGCEADLTR